MHREKINRYSSGKLGIICLAAALTASIVRGTVTKLILVAPLVYLNEGDKMSFFIDIFTVGIQVIMNENV